MSTPGVVLAAGAGTAVNAFLPARMGEPVRLWVAGRAAPTVARPTILAAFLTIVSADIIIGTGIIALGGVFGLGEPLALLLERYLGTTGVLIAAAAIAAAVGAVLIAGRRSGRLTLLRAQLRAGLEPLESIGFYLSRVLSLQIGAWVMRAVAAALLLAAVGVPVTAANVAVVVAAQAAATAVPFQPGGFLLKLGVFLVAFAESAAGPTEIVAFAVLYELTLYLTNVLFGLASLGVVFRDLRWREIVARVRRIGAPSSDDSALATRAASGRG